MKLLLREKYLRFSVPRIIFFGMMAAALFVYPPFVQTGVFYAVTGYLALAGLLGAADGVRTKRKKKASDYAGSFISIALLLSVIFLLLFARYFVKVSPLFLSVFLLMNGVYCCTVSYCVPAGWRRGILILLSALVLLGSMAVVLFTLGFGAGGLSGLSGVSGITLSLSCLYALMAYVFYHRNTKQ